MLEDSASEALLDLDALSGLTEISLDKEEGSGEKSIVKFGVSVGPSSSSVMVSSQIVTMVPRHVVFNESEESITVRQYYLEVCSLFNSRWLLDDFVQLVILLFFLPPRPLPNIFQEG